MEITIKWTVDSKSDEEAKNKVKALLNTAYGDMVNQHPEDELHPMDEVIQDLKLENDRLKQRNDLMLSFLNAMCCIETNIPCMKCIFRQAGGCTLKTENYEKEALRIIKKLEEL